MLGNKYYSCLKMSSKIQKLEDILLLKLHQRYKLHTRDNINLIGNIVGEIRRQLTEEDLKSLSRVQIEELGEKMFLAYERSRVQSEDRVGLKSGQYLGNIVTQISLDSKHAAGAKKDINVMKAIETIVNFTASKNSDIVIYFDKDMSARNVMRERHKIQPTYLGDIIDSIEGKIKKDYSKDKWETLFEIIYQENIDPSDYWVHIQLDMEKVFTRELKLKYIVDKILSFFGDYSVIYNSVTGEIKLFHQFNNLTEVDMNKMLIPKLKEVKICGVSFIKSVHPVKINRLKAIKKIEKGVIIIDDEYMYKYNLSYSLLQNYIEKRIDGKLKETSPRSFKIISSKVPENEILRILNEFDVKLSDIVKGKRFTKYKNEVDLPKGYDIVDNKLQTKERLDIFVFLRKFYEESVMVYFVAESSSSNKSVNEILEFDNVNQDYTYEDNVNYIIQTQGIEAARNFYVEKLVQLFGTVIDKQHIEMLADTATYIGKKISTLRYGHEELTVGWIDAATFEEAQKNLLERAAIGNRDDLKSLSAQRLTGSLINMNQSFELMNK